MEHELRTPTGRTFSPLSLIALISVAVVVLVQVPAVFFDAPPRQGYAWFVLAILTPLILLTIRFATPGAFDRIRARPALLVPLGAVTGMIAVINWLWGLSTLAALSTPFFEADLLGISLSFSVLFVVYLAVWVCYGAWQTRLVISAVWHDRVSPGDALGEAPRYFLRTLLIGFVGHGILLLTMAPIIAIGAGTGALPVALILIGMVAILWNLLTAGLLVVGLREADGALQALAAGFRAGVANFRKWWLPVLAQMLLLGVATLIVVSYSTTSSEGGNRHHTDYSKTEWGVNGSWTGGYPDSSEWLDKTMAAVESSASALVTTLLGLLLGVLAIAVKLHVAEVICKADWSRLGVSVRSNGNVHRLEPE